MAYSRTHTIDSGPSGDTVKAAIAVKLDGDLTNIFTYLNAHDVATTNIHGLGSGTVCGTTNAQTLENKTIVNPVISGSISNASIVTPTFSGAITSGNATFNGGTLSGVTMTGTITASGATLLTPTFSGAITSGNATFNGGTLSGVTMTGTITASGATIIGPTITGGTITQSTIDGITHRGASAPDNPIEGQRWWDTSGGATAEILKRYTAAAGWVSLLTMNVTAGTITQLYGILDEDDMASDSALLPPSQQSVKAYVDAVKVPVGAMIDWPTETVPTGWLERNGASLLRADYPALFAVIGTMYGAADATHFNLPDDRGLFGRWWAHGRATDPDRATRTAPAATGATLTAGDHVGTEQADAVKDHTHTGGVQLTANTANGAQGAYAVGDTSYATGAMAGGGSETRPANRAYMPIIKY